MKATYNLILAAFAAAVALSSCTKDIAAEKQDTESGDLRTIEISFETPTKTVLNEDDPTRPQVVFKNGDKIMVANGNEWEECTVTPSFIGQGRASFTTKLQGDLTAVYPSKAAIVNKGELADNVKVPASQTGRFEDASIAFGTLSGKGMITLKHMTAVLRFYVGPSIGVDSLVIEAKENYLADGEFDEDGKRLSDKPVKKITIKPQGDEDVCYVAVRESRISDDTLTVKSYTQTQKAENEDGLVIRRYCPVNLKIEMLADVFIPYYIEVPVGDKTQKWGYCNVGAIRPEDAGKYFAWGSTDGHKWIEQNQDYHFEGYHEFNWRNCPFNDEKEEFDATSFDSKKDEVCPDGTLIPEYDAASDLWKGGWRMPTKAEIDSLYAHVDSTWIGEKGLAIPVSNGTLFFPLTGYGYYYERENKSCVADSDCGMYWTSSLDTTDNAKAYYFNFTYYAPEHDSDESGFHLYGESYSRDFGMPIRPIFDPQLPQEVSFEILPKYEFGGNL